jgi:threonine/homoserine/homoserine lactone efflux protein
MTSSFISVAIFDNTDPGAAGWLMLAVWFILFVFVLNTIIFFLRRLFRRWRSSSSSSKAGIRHGD